MLVVALGHWLGMVVVLDGRGKLVTGNALEMVPALWPATWAFQVMPLFFFVGGFASASSLQSAARDGVRAQDWTLTRLRRMLAPAAALATFWIVAICVGAAIGQARIVTAGAVAAAIPLWFLANYVIDTVAAPITYRWFRHNPTRLAVGFVAVFSICEAANVAGIPHLPQVNWVIGWMGFQIAGFAWQGGLLPAGRRLLATAAGFWIAAIAAVALGPWPAPMLHHGGLRLSPTHPPSLAFVLFGLAYGLTAAAAAPAIDRWLGRSQRAWEATIRANGIAMSVYLWHMTAAVAYTGVLFYTHRITSATPGTGAWWATKLPLVACSAPLLAAIVWRVNPIERRALLSPRATWRGGYGMLIFLGVLASVAVKMWSSPSPAVLTAGIAVLLVVWHAGLRCRRERKGVSWAADARGERLG